MISNNGSGAETVHFDPGHIFISNVPQMVEDARYAAETDSYSYRGFRVGVTGHAITPESHNSATITAGNVKARREKDKICGEMRVLAQAKKAGFTVVQGLVVVSTTDSVKIKEVTGAATPTLHPCNDVCLPAFLEHPLIWRDTVIVTTGLDEDRYEVHTSGQLCELYEEGDTETLESARPMYGFEDWSRRVLMYDGLSAANQQLTEAQKLPTGNLIQLAMTMSLQDL